MNTIEDQILKYIHEHSIAHPKDIRDRFPKAGQILASLDEMKLTTKVPGKQFSVTLTDKGREAVKKGFVQYKNEINKNEKNETKKKWLKRIKFILEYAAAIYSIIVLVRECL